MEEMDYPFDLNNKLIGQQFLELLDSVLNDSDAVDEKATVKDFIKSASCLLEICLLGKYNTKQICLTSALFDHKIIGKSEGIRQFIEYRYGEREVEFQVNVHLLRSFQQTKSLQGLSVVEIPDLHGMEKEQAEICNQYLHNCDVLLVAFESEGINDLAIWDLLETVEAKKMVFVIMTVGTVDQMQLQAEKEKLGRYVKEANLAGPVYSLDELEELRSYVNQHIIGNNPKLQKQYNNVMKLKELLGELNKSYLLRKQQYEQDVLVVSRINKSMDGFILDSQEKIEGLKSALKNDIYTAIRQYEDEIVSKLNPMQIKERFPRGDADFVDYLNFINESYRVRMTDNVNRKTQEAIRSYLKELEIVFDEATGFFRKRETMIALEDKFYGSMAASKQQVIGKIKNDLHLTNEYYRSLSDASGELFDKLWAERQKYDKKVNDATTLGAVGGAVVGTGTLVGGVGMLGALGVVSGGAAGAIAAMGVLWPVVATVVGAACISRMAKKISSSRNMAELEKNVQEAIRDFRSEVSRTKEEMVVQIMDTIDSIFRQELEAADRTFADFRLSVNIDGNNIPLLDEKLEKLNALMEHLEEGNILPC